MSTTTTTTKPTVKQFFTPVEGSENDWYLTLSNNSLKQFATCPRACEYYVLERRRASKGSAAVNAGDIFHRAQDVRARVKDPEQLATLQTQLIEKCFVESPVEDDEYRNAERVSEACKRYNKVYKNDTSEVIKNSDGEPLTEIKFVLPLGRIEVNANVYIGRGEYIYIETLFVQWQGRIDQLISQDFQNFIKDFKTTSRGGSTYFDQFPLSQQLMGYVWAVRQLWKNGKVSGAIVDLTVWRRPTPTGKPFDFDRQRFYYSDEQLDEWQSETMGTVASFVACLKAGQFPMSGTLHGCAFKYGQCEYFSVCTLPKAQREEGLHLDEFQDVLNRPEDDEV